MLPPQLSLGIRSSEVSPAIDEIRTNPTDVIAFVKAGSLSASPLQPVTRREILSALRTITDDISATQRSELANLATDPSSPNLDVAGRLVDILEDAKRRELDRIRVRLMLFSLFEDKAVELAKTSATASQFSDLLNSLMKTDTVGRRLGYESNNAEYEKHTLGQYYQVQFDKRKLNLTRSIDAGLAKLAPLDSNFHYWIETETATQRKQAFVARVEKIRRSYAAASAALSLVDLSRIDNEIREMEAKLIPELEAENTDYIDHATSISLVNDRIVLSESAFKKCYDMNDQSLIMKVNTLVSDVDQLKRFATVQAQFARYVPEYLKNMVAEREHDLKKARKDHHLLDVDNLRLQAQVISNTITKCVDLIASPYIPLAGGDVAIQRLRNYAAAYQAAAVGEGIAADEVELYNRSQIEHALRTNAASPTVLPIVSILPSVSSALSSPALPAPTPAPVTQPPVAPVSSAAAAAAAAPQITYDKPSHVATMKRLIAQLEKIDEFPKTYNTALDDMKNKLGADNSKVDTETANNVDAYLNKIFIEWKNSVLDALEHLKVPDAKKKAADDQKAKLTGIGVINKDNVTAVQQAIKLASKWEAESNGNKSGSSSGWLSAARKGAAGAVGAVAGYFSWRTATAATPVKSEPAPDPVIAASATTTPSASRSSSPSRSDSKMSAAAAPDLDADLGLAFGQVTSPPSTSRPGTVRSSPVSSRPGTPRIKAEKVDVAAAGAPAPAPAPAPAAPKPPTPEEIAELKRQLNLAVESYISALTAVPYDIGREGDAFTAVVDKFGQLSAFDLTLDKTRPTHELFLIVVDAFKDEFDTTGKDFVDTWKTNAIAKIKAAIDDNVQQRSAAVSVYHTALDKSTATVPIQEANERIQHLLSVLDDFLDDAPPAIDPADAGTKKYTSMKARYDRLVSDQFLFEDEKPKDASSSSGASSAPQVRNLPDFEGPFKVGDDLYCTIYRNENAWKPKLTTLKTQKKLKRSWTLPRLDMVERQVKKKTEIVDVEPDSYANWKGNVDKNIPSDPKNPPRIVDTSLDARKLMGSLLIDSLANVYARMGLTLIGFTSDKLDDTEKKSHQSLNFVYDASSMVAFPNDEEAELYAFWNKPDLAPKNFVGCALLTPFIVDKKLGTEVTPAERKVDHIKIDYKNAAGVDVSKTINYSSRWDVTELSGLFTAESAAKGTGKSVLDAVVRILKTTRPTVSEIVLEVKKYTQLDPVVAKNTKPDWADGYKRYVQDYMKHVKMPIKLSEVQAAIAGAGSDNIATAYVPAYEFLHSLYQGKGWIDCNQVSIYDGPIDPSKTPVTYIRHATDIPGFSLYYYTMQNGTAQQVLNKDPYVMPGNTRWMIRNIKNDNAIVPIGDFSAVPIKDGIDSDRDEFSFVSESSTTTTTDTVATDLPASNIAASPASTRPKKSLVMDDYDYNGGVWV